MNDKRNITIGDVADALGISKSTVSRAISGKGRVGEATRNEVLRYIEEHNYVPSALARGLANQRTYNVGLIMPDNFADVDLPFFQKCLMGICETAHENDYNVLISMAGNSDNTQLERMLDNRKIDGVLLTRTQADDAKVRLLQERDIPFVTIGSYDDDNVIQVDNDNERACYELTRKIIEGGAEKIILVSQDNDYIVTKLRMKGFLQAADESDIEVRIHNVPENVKDKAWEVIALNEAQLFNADYVICMDDGICLRLLDEAYKKGLRISEDLKIASFYGSALLDKYSQDIVSVEFDSRNLGKIACKTLLDVIEEREYSDKTLLDYSLNV